VKTLCALIASSAACVLLGCDATLRNVPSKALAGSNAPPDGVPWVESRRYDVYLYQGGPNGGQLLFHDRLALGDRLNGAAIDDGRPKWEVNYDAGPMSNASIEIEFHENGSLKKAAITTNPKSAAVVEAGTAALSVQDEIEKKELERLKRKKDLQDAKDALNKKPSSE